MQYKSTEIIYSFLSLINWKQNLAIPFMYLYIQIYKYVRKFEMLANLLYVFENAQSGLCAFLL